MLSGAIVGFGEVARHGHWPAYAASRDARIVAVADRTAERRAAAAALDPALRTVGAFDELAAGPRLDFVDICTPPALHAEPMLAAIARGWHVLCEKPFLLDPDLFEHVKRAAAARGVAVLPVHNWKLAPILVRASGLLHGGDIGRLRRVEIETLRLRDCSVADPERPNWRRDPAIAGGGILMDHGWHAIYLALDWFAEEPIDVRATLHRSAPDGAEDEAAVSIAFPSGEAAITLSWNAHVRRNTVRLVGDAGEIVAADDTLNAPHGVERFPRALSAGSHHEDWFAAMLPGIVAAFRRPRLARQAFDEARTCLEIVRRAYASAGAAAVVKWPAGASCATRRGRCAATVCSARPAGSSTSARCNAVCT
jgi:predicted dehydrogenase